MRNKSIFVRFWEVLFNKYTMLMLASLEACLLVFLYKEKELTMQLAKEQTAVGLVNEKGRAAKCFRVECGNLTGFLRLSAQIKSQHEIQLTHNNNRSMVVKKVAKGGSFIRKGEIIFEFLDPETDRNWYSSRAQAVGGIIEYENAVNATRKGKLHTDNELTAKKTDRDIKFYTYLGSLEQKELIDIIRAPFDGQLGLHNITVGETVPQGKVMATLVDTENLILIFFISPNDCILAPGDRLQVIKEGAQETSVYATVDEVSPFVEESHSKLKVKAKIEKTVDNYDEIKEKFKINTYVFINIPKRPLENVIIVHCNAIIDNDGKNFVCKVVRAPKVDGNSGSALVTKVCEVKILDTQGDLVAIESNGSVSAGDFVIVDGPKRSGVKVNLTREDVVNVNKDSK